jgi:hypothetical protein
MLQYNTYFYPGKKLEDTELSFLVEEMREVASSCFDELPIYQALTGDRNTLKRVVVTTVRNKKGRLLGFCSAIELPVKDVGNVLHLGLTCVDPNSRGLRLTHKLTSRLLLNYLIKQNLFSKTWVSNCACVLSSLGNVALYFEDVYPSPYGPKLPSQTHKFIAQAIDENYRDDMAVNVGAKFDIEKFIFRASVEGTTFQKDANDKRFHHRNETLTSFYTDLLEFEKGDEALQVGKVSLFTFPMYFLNQVKKKLTRQLSSQESLTHVES